MPVYDNRESKINISELLTPQEYCHNIFWLQLLKWKDLQLFFVTCKQSLVFILPFGEKRFEALTLASGNLSIPLNQYYRKVSIVASL